MVRPSARGNQGASDSITASTVVTPCPTGQVSAEMQPGHRMEQPWSQMPSRRPGPSVVTGKWIRETAISVTRPNQSESCRRSGVESYNSEMTSGAILFKQGAGTGLDQVGFELIAYSSAAV